ncbi:MAG: enolase C-terminal domain-like protein [Propionibacteriaceae bacterium]
MVKGAYSHRIGQVAAATSIPVATGERLYTRQEFLEVLEAGVSIVQPDLSHAGGITEVRKIAALAETYGAVIARHCPLGPIGLAASLQIGFCTASHVIQEQSIGIHYNVGAEVLDYLVDTSVFDDADGSVARLVGPGLGTRGGRDGGTEGGPGLDRVGQPRLAQLRRRLRRMVTRPPTATRR